MDPEIPQEGRSIPRLIVSIVLGLLVVVAVVLVGLRLVRERMTKPGSETTVASLSPSPTQTPSGGFPTVSQGSVTPTQSPNQFSQPITQQTGQTKGGQPVVSQPVPPGQLPASGPETLGLLMLTGTGLAGVLLRSRKL